MAGLASLRDEHGFGFIDGFGASALRGYLTDDPAGDAELGMLAVQPDANDNQAAETCGTWGEHHTHRTGQQQHTHHQSARELEQDGAAYDEEDVSQEHWRRESSLEHGSPSIEEYWNEPDDEDVLQTTTTVHLNNALLPVRASVPLAAKPHTTTAHIPAPASTVGKRSNTQFPLRLAPLPLQPVSMIASAQSSLGTADMSPYSQPGASSRQSTAEWSQDQRVARQNAIRRYREKRARRSFARRVKYSLRASVAQLKPRVKGRFVKASELHLYHQYGDSYREHLDEL